jgi:uncharacterized membrane protein
MGISANARLMLSAFVGLVAGAVVAIVGPWWLAPLSAWVVAAAVWLTWTWTSFWPLDPTQTARHATSESPDRLDTDLTLLSGSIVSLAAVGLVLVRASHETGLDKGLLVAVGVASIVLAWGVVHTVYTIRYAKLYFQERPHGIDFNGDDAPCYPDFAYLALTIGMTFQVSDTDLTSKGMRRLALPHALLSYMFGTLIIATTINLIAGLGK